MKVLCCPVEGKLWPATWESLAKYAPDAEIITIPGGDITRPWRDYAARWGTEDLLVVEQDVVLHEDVIPQLEACPEPWCSFPGRHYACTDNGFMLTGILCVRFRAEFMAAVPVSAVEAQYGSCNRCDGQNPQCHAHIDGRIREAGEAAGYKIHLHWPSVGHREFPPGEFE